MTIDSFPPALRITDLYKQPTQEIITPALMLFSLTYFSIDTFKSSPLYNLNACSFIFFLPIFSYLDKSPPVILYEKGVFLFKSFYFKRV